MNKNQYNSVMKSAENFIEAFKGLKDKNSFIRFGTVYSNITQHDR